jgi:hypothetical protein
VNVSGNGKTAGALRKELDGMCAGMEVAKIISPMQPDCEQVDQLAVVGGKFFRASDPVSQRPGS